MNMAYEFGLFDGVLSVTAIENQPPLIAPVVAPCHPSAQAEALDFLECPVNPTCDEDCCDFEKPCPGESFPQQLYDAALGQQTQVIAPCANGSPLPIATTVGALAHDGALTLKLSAQDANTVQAVVADVRNWQCDANGNAVIVARAKRINVYGDAVELVWFDQADPSDLMYGLYAALVQGQIKPPFGVQLPAPSTLCARPLPDVGGVRIVAGHALQGPRFVGRDMVTVAAWGPGGG